MKRGLQLAPRLKRRGRLEDAEEALCLLMAAGHGRGRASGAEPWTSGTRTAEDQRGIAEEVMARCGAVHPQTIS